MNAPKRSALLACASAFLILPFMPICSGVTVATWNGGNGSFTNAANWSGGVVPTNNGTNKFDARVDGGKPAASVVSLSSAVVVDSLTIDTGDQLKCSNAVLGVVSTLSNAGTIENDSGTLRIDLTTPAAINWGIVRARGSLQIDNSSDFGLANNGQMVAQGATALLAFGGSGVKRGTITGNGEFVADGGVLKVHGDINFNTAGTLKALNGGTVQMDASIFNAATVDISLSGVVNAPNAAVLNATIKNEGQFNAREGTSAFFVAGPKLAIGGNVTGNGEFTGNLKFDGITSPGSVAGQRGVMSVHALSLGATHTLFTDFAATGDFDHLVVVGELAIDGTLQLNRVAGFVPNYAVPQRVVSASFSHGLFSRVQGISIDANRSFAVTYDSAGVLVTCALPGDVNLDRSVNFTDLLVLAQQYGKPTGQSWETADFTGDGATTFDDLLVLVQRYGGSVLADAPVLSPINHGAFFADLALAQSLVPEPASVSAIIGIALALLPRQGRRV